MLSKIKRLAALLLALALVCGALPAVAMAAVTPAAVVRAAAMTSIDELYAGDGDGLYYYNGQNMTYDQQSQKGIPGGKTNDWGITQIINGQGEWVPLYFYWVENGKPVSVDPAQPPQYSPIMQFDYSKWLEYTPVDVTVTTANETVRMWTVQLKATATVSGVHSGKLTFADAAGTLHTTSFSMAQNLGGAQGGASGTIGVCGASNIGSLLQNPWPTVWSNLSSWYQDGLQSSMEYHYLYTNDPAGVENNKLTQAGEIKMETLQITSSDPSLVRVVGTVSETQEEDTSQRQSAVGFQVEIIPPSQEVYKEGRLVELTVSFTGADDTAYIYRSSYVFTDRYMGETVTVNNTADFQNAYKRMITGTILLEDGVYNTDLIFGEGNRQVAIHAVNYGQAVIAGAPGSTAPILQYANNSNTWGLIGIVIDGNENPGEKRVGVGTVCEVPGPTGAPIQISALAANITVRDCSVGVQAPGASLALSVGPMQFENCDVAIDANAASLVAQSCNFIDCGTAIKLRPRSEGAYTSAIIRNCRFVNSPDKTDLYDLAMYQPHSELQFTQNYFGTGIWDTASTSVLSVRKPRIYRENGTEADMPVYYAPYIVDNIWMNTLSADLDSVQTVTDAAGTTATLPVDNTKTYGEYAASMLDAALFEELKNGGTDLTIQIPITEKKSDGTPAVTTEWEYSSDELTVDTDMDMRVSSTPSGTDVSGLAEAELGGGNVAQYVNFSHEGALPGKATVRVLKSSVANLDDLKLYHIEKDAAGNSTQVVLNTYSEVTTEVIGGETYYVLTIDHCSEYVVAAGPDPAACAHTGGVADCTTRAVCSNCKALYGDFVHTYDQKVTTDIYLSAAATTSSPALYFHSCSCGAKGSTTFASGSALQPAAPGTGSGTPAPNTSIPATGDTAGMALWLVLAPVCALAAAAALTPALRKKHKA